MQVLASVTDSIHRHVRGFQASRRRLWWNAVEIAVYLSLWSVFFCTLWASVLNPVSRKFSPHYSKDLEHEIGFASMWMSDCVMVKHGLLDGRWLTGSEGLMQWVTQLFKCGWCELAVMASSSAGIHVYIVRVWSRLEYKVERVEIINGFTNAYREKKNRHALIIFPPLLQERNSVWQLNT